MAMSKQVKEHDMANQWEYATASVAMEMANNFKWQTESISKITHVPMIYAVCALAHDVRLVPIHLHALRYRTNPKFITMSHSFSTTLPSRYKVFRFRSIRVLTRTFIFILLVVSGFAPFAVHFHWRFIDLTWCCYIYACGGKQRVRNWSANDD